MQLQANLPDTLPGQNVTFLLFGNVEIENAVVGDSEATPEAGDGDFAPLTTMQAFYFTSSVGDLIFEAPTKAAQAWFVKHFGPSVNLGNIPPDEVIPLETLRLGLRADTLKEVLLADREPASS